MSGTPASVGTAQGAALNVSDTQKVRIVTAGETVVVRVMGGPAGPAGPPNAGVFIKGIAAAWPPATAATVGDLYVIPVPAPAGAPAWALPGHGAFWDGVDWIDAGPLRGAPGERGEPGPPLRVRGEATAWPPDASPQPGDIWALPDPAPAGTPPQFHAGGAAAWDEATKSWVPLTAIRGPAGRGVAVYGPSPTPPLGVTLYKGDMWLSTDSSTFSPSFDPAHWNTTLKLASLSDVADVAASDGQGLVYAAAQGQWFPGAPIAHIEEWTPARSSYPTGAVVHWEGRLWRARQHVPTAHEPKIPDGAASVWTSDTGGKVYGPFFPSLVALQPATLRPPQQPPPRVATAMTYNVADGDWRLWHSRPHSTGGHITSWTWELVTPALLGRSTIISAGAPPFHAGPLQGLLWIYGLPGTPHVPTPVDDYWEPIVLGQYLASLADVDMYSKPPIVGDTLVWDGLRWTADAVQFPSGQHLPAIEPGDIGKTLAVKSDLTVHLEHIIPPITPANIGHILEVGPDLRPRWVPKS